MHLYFQHHYCSLQCHMIFRNHYNILICCSRNISGYYYHSKVWVKKAFKLKKKEIQLLFCSSIFIMLQKIFISNKCCSFELLSILKNKMHHSHPKKYCAARLFSTLIIIRNIYCAANQHIMISEGSCDTEDCSYDYLISISLYIC